jgi:hypothetical protein
MSKIKYLSFALLILSIIILFNGCSENCPTSRGEAVSYIDTSSIPDINMLENNKWLRNNTVKEIVQNNSIGEYFWGAGDCRPPTENYYIYDEGIRKKVKKTEFEEYISEYNRSCEGCVKEVLFESYI